MVMIVLVQWVWSPWLAAPPIGVMVSDTSKDIVTLIQICTGHETLDEEKDSHSPHNFNYVSGYPDPEPKR